MTFTTVTTNLVDRVEDFTIGRWSHHQRVTVNFGLEHRFYGGGDEVHFDIHHRPTFHTIEFTASAVVYERGRDVMGGQCLDSLGDLDLGRLTTGWTKADVASLHAIWKRWHLNAMRPICAHLDRQYEKDPRGYGTRLRIDGEGTVCPFSGYKAGRAWLYDPMPEEAITEIKRLLALARSAA